MHDLWNSNPRAHAAAMPAGSDFYGETLSRAVAPNGRAYARRELRVKCAEVFRPCSASRTSDRSFCLGGKCLKPDSKGLSD